MISKKSAIDDKNLNDLLFRDQPNSNENLDEEGMRIYNRQQENADDDDDEDALENYQNHYDGENNGTSNQYGQKFNHQQSHNVQGQKYNNNQFQNGTRDMKLNQNYSSKNVTINTDRNQNQIYQKQNKNQGYRLSENDLVDSNASSGTKQYVHEQQKKNTFEMFQQQNIHNNLYGINEMQRTQHFANQMVDQSPNKLIDEQDQQIANVINEIPCPFGDLSMTSNSNSSTPDKSFQKFGMNQNNRLSNQGNQFNKQNLPRFNGSSGNIQQKPRVNSNFQNEDNYYQEEEQNLQKNYQLSNQQQKQQDEDDASSYNNFNQNQHQQKNPFQNNKMQSNNNNNQDWQQNIIKTTNLFPEINMPTMELSNENSAIFSQYQNKYFQSQPTYKDKLEQNRQNLKQFQQQMQENSALKQYQNNKIEENEVDESSYQQSNQKTHINKNGNNNYQGYSDISQNMEKSENFQDVQQDECEEVEDPRIFQYQQQKFTKNNLANQAGIQVDGFQDQDNNHSHNNLEQSNNQFNVNFQDNSQLFDQKSNFGEDMNEIHQKVAQSLSRINQSIAEKQVVQLQGLVKDKDKVITGLQYEQSQLYERINEIEEKFSLLSEKYKDASSLEQLRGKSLDGAQKQIAKLRNILDKKENKIVRLSEQVSQLASHVEQLEQAIEQELYSVNQEISKYKIIHDSYVKRISENEQQIQQLSQHNEYIMQENSARLQKLEQEMNILRKQCKSKDDIREGDLQQIKQNNSEIERLQSVIKQIEEERKVSESKFKELRDQFDLVMIQKADANTLKEYEKVLGLEDGFDAKLVGENNNMNLNHQKKQFDDELSRIKTNYERQIAKLKEELAYQKELSSKEVFQQVINPDENNVQRSNRSQDSRIINIEFLQNNNNATLNQTQNNDFNQTKSDVVQIGYSRPSELIKQSLKDFNIIQDFNLIFNDSDENRDPDILVSFIQQVANKIQSYKADLLEKDKILKELQSKFISLQQDFKVLKNEKELLASQLKVNRNPLQDSISEKSPIVQQLQDTVLNLEETIKILEKSKSQYQEEIDAYKHTIEILKTQIDECQHSNNYYLNQNELLSQKVSEQEQEIHFLNEQLNQLQDSDQNHSQEMKKAYSQRQEYVESQLTEKINGLQEKLKKKNNELTDISISKQQMTDELRQFKNKYNEITLNYEKQLNAEKKKLKDLQEINEQLTEQLKQQPDLYNQLQQSQYEHTFKKEKIEEYETQIDKLKTNLKKQQEEYSSIENELESCQQQLKQEKIEKNRVQNQLNTQTSCLKLVEKEKDLLLEEKKQNQKLQKEIDILKNEVKQKQDEIKNLIKASKENEENLSTQIKDFQQKLEKSNLNLKKTEESKNAAVEKNTELTAQIDLQQNNNKLIKQKEEYIKVLEEQKDKLEKQVKEKDKKNIELFNNQKQIQDQIKKAEQNCNQCKEELEKTKKQLNLKQHDIKQLTNKCQDLHKSHQDLSTRYEEIVLKNDLLSTQLNSEKPTTSRSQSRIKTQEDQSINNSEFEQVKVFLTQKNQQLQIQLRESLEKQEDLERENNQLNRELEDNNMANEALHSKLEDLSIKNNKQQQDIQQLNLQIKDLVEVNNQLKEQMNEIMNEQSISKSQINLTSKTIKTNQQTNLNRVRDENIDILNQNDISQSINKTTMKKQQDFNPMDQFSPEMLSAEDTINLMLDILRRTTKSNEMTRLLVNSDEFVDLIEQIKIINNESNFFGGDTRSEQKSQRSFSILSSANKYSSNHPHQKTILNQFQNPQQQQQQFLQQLQQQMVYLPQQSLQSQIQQQQQYFSNQSLMYNNTNQNSMSQSQIQQQYMSNNPNVSSSNLSNYSTQQINYQQNFIPDSVKSRRNNNISGYY
ncbi:hypothetical protein ABPG72_015612 [Tetrahymena utriculariae]